MQQSLISQDEIVSARVPGSVVGHLSSLEFPSLKTLGVLAMPIGLPHHDCACLSGGGKSISPSHGHRNHGTGKHDAHLAGGTCWYFQIKDGTQLSSPKWTQHAHVQYLDHMSDLSDPGFQHAQQSKMLKVFRKFCLRGRRLHCIDLQDSSLVELSTCQGIYDVCHRQSVHLADEGYGHLTASSNFRL